MINVSQRQLDIILGIIKKYVPDCEVRVFGSRYKGTNRQYSDLDLAIKGIKVLEISRIMDMKEAFETSDLPFRVDVLDWNGISEEFRRIIGFEYEVVYSPGEGGKQHKKEN